HASYQSGTRYRIDSSPSWRAIWFNQVVAKIDTLSNQDLILALTFGYREFISQQRWLELKSSVLVHLVAISGLHIGMAFGIGYQVGRGLRCMMPAMIWLPFVSGLFIAIIYSWFSGFTLPTLRAVVMCCLGSYFVWLGRSVGRLNFILLSVCIVLLMWPYSILTSSFWLSFGALAAVLYAVSLFNSSKTQIGPLDKAMLVVKIQCVLTLLLLPMTLYYYQGVSALSLVYNLLLLPWITFVVMPLLFLSLVCQILFSSDTPFLWQGINVLLEAVSISAAWSPPYWWVFDR
ncbi:ComEC/Rec2 family competence protein, partial [Vibrio sp. D173a]|uniref:ComEC/Rec2 family competence protein n=1 Tax=Vibrio sp. D173a TaxID=2836349 RepID=UPI00255538EA